MGIQSGSKGDNVQLKVFGDVLEELSSSRSNPGVVPRRFGAIQLKVMDALEVGRNVLVGGVDQGLVQIDQQNEPAAVEKKESQGGTQGG